MLRKRTAVAAAARRFCSTSSQQQPDVIIIGAGVIGSSCALQLARKGYRTLNLDKGAAVGSGSTSYSSGNLRTMYTALTSTKFADEGYRFWQSWSEQLQHTAGDGDLAVFRQCGGGVIWTDAATTFLESCYTNHNELGLPYEVWDREELQSRIPVFDLTSYYPPRRIDDPLFGTPSKSTQVHGAGYFPQAGYVSDPMLAASNLMTAAQATGRASVRYNAAVASIDLASGALVPWPLSLCRAWLLAVVLCHACRSGHLRLLWSSPPSSMRNAGGTGGEPRVSGVTLSDGETISAPIVLNVGGPHSSQVALYMHACITAAYLSSLHSSHLLFLVWFSSSLLSRALAYVASALYTSLSLSLSLARSLARLLADHRHGF